MSWVYDGTGWTCDGGNSYAWWPSQAEFVGSEVIISVPEGVPVIPANDLARQWLLNGQLSVIPVKG
jgi:hypothetical protein